ncbi:MAG: metallophosphoesterase [Pirellulales bacterium]|nr:metallophosphoesterase [Pirellulales bacterium]
MKLYAISDLHLGHEINRRALATLEPHPDDWLIVAGDVGESVAHLELCLRIVTARFRQVIWVPGNHDLWTMPGDDRARRGEALYLHLVSICRRYRVLTPEDPFPRWTGDGVACTLCPLFLLYDYSFRPDEIPAESVIDWAMESGVLCADEGYLHPDPYPTRQAWCEARCRLTERRLAAVDPRIPTVLINHFPLRRDLLKLHAIPRFSIWCGTRRTEDWHKRFRAIAVLSGHQHVRGTDYRDGVRFEEVSLGYPNQWKQEYGIESYLCEVLPGPPGAMM